MAHSNSPVIDNLSRAGAVIRDYATLLDPTRLTGLPALTISTGITGNTPIGVQLVSPRFREDICLAAAAILERAGTPESPVEP